MRQTPTQNRHPGGRQMPAWFTTTPGTQPPVTPPPVPAEPPPVTDESEYEEIDQLASNQNGLRRSGKRKTCSLCGTSNAVVTCELCDNQLFCGSCNDMYHRHPKRLHHTRKLIESTDNNPPLPPKPIPAAAVVPPEPPSHEPLVTSLPPVPPPRQKRRLSLGLRNTSSPSLVKKTFDPVGTLKRFVGGMTNRPLPALPKPPPPLPPKPTNLSRPSTPVMSGYPTTPTFDRRQSSPSPFLPNSSHNSPMMFQEFNHRQRNQSASIANLAPPRPPSRISNLDWQDEEEYYTRERAHSISTPHRFPTSHNDASHFATLHRPNRGPLPPERPPPLPPRSFPSQPHLAFQGSQSVFNLSQMPAPTPAFGVPWGYFPQGYPGEFQQPMFGFPTGTMKRTVSNASMGAVPQQFFGWTPMGFGPPMTQQEMEMEILSRQRAEQQVPSRSQWASQSQPVTPQGSFRKKTKPASFQERQTKKQPDLIQRSTPVKQLQQRAPTPDDFAKANKPLAPDIESEQTTSIDITESPEGPWTCEHCTFINPKSTKICTVCCKTPSGGYQSMMKSIVPKRKESSSSVNEEVPIVQSTLSISRDEKQQATINLVESVERVKTPNKMRMNVKAKNSSQGQATQLNDDEEETQDLQQKVKEVLESLDDDLKDHAVDSKTKSKSKEISANAEVINSNEDVYGSVPLQALSISPKIDIRRPSKTSHKKAAAASSSSPKSLSPTPPVGKGNRSSSKHSSETKSTTKKNKRAPSNSSSSSGKSETSKKSNSLKKSTCQSKNQYVSTGIQAESGESGNESFRSAPSNNGSSDSASYNSTEANLGSIVAENKSSKGTSPPPQSISTQTYDEYDSLRNSSLAMSKTSTASTQSLQSDDYASPRPVEMSEKAMRYLRKAQHHQQAKLKRSMSIHLASAAEPWMESDAHGRPLYRSSSRHSIYSDTRSLPLSGPPSRESSPPLRSNRFLEDFRSFHPSTWERLPNPEDYFASIEDLVSRKRRESVRSQEFELTRLIKEAEDSNYSAEDLQVAFRMCGDQHPLRWLQENWTAMIDTVQTLSTKYGIEKGPERNQIGIVTTLEARDALRTHKGNVWAAVTECIEQRRRKFLEIQSRGSFMRNDILAALASHNGNSDAAFIELSKNQLKPFLMKIIGNDSTQEVDNGSNKVEPRVVSEYRNKSPEFEPAHNHVEEAENYENLRAEPRLEKLVSSAAKVSEEIERVIKELRDSKITQDATSTTIKSDVGVNGMSNEITPEIPLHSKEKEDQSPNEDEDGVVLSGSITLPLVHPEKVLSSKKKKLVKKTAKKPQVLDNITAIITENLRKETENPEQAAQVNSSDLENLVTSFTTTLNMQNIAAEIKEKIATEIQKQIQEAVQANSGNLPQEHVNEAHLTSQDDATEESQHYEPVILTDSVTENVNKKLAKYKKVVAKKSRKSSRHKSPDPRAQQKEDSVSPTPAVKIPVTRPQQGSSPTPTEPLASETRISQTDLHESETGVVESNSDSESKLENNEAEEVERDEREYISDPDSVDESDEAQTQQPDKPDLDVDAASEMSSPDDQNSSDNGPDAEDDYEEVTSIYLSALDLNNGVQEGNVHVMESYLDNLLNDNDDPSENSSSSATSVLVPKELENEEEPEILSNVPEKTEHEIKVDRLLGLGKVETTEQANLALKLMELNFAEDDSICAANECSSLSSALSYLQQECGLCAGKFCARQMVSMLKCTHVCCKNCAKEYFTVQVRDKSILDSTCPFCGEPSNLNDDNEVASDYFNHLDILLKSILEPKFHEMFQRKLRDWALAQTPNFKWCSKCSSGFITEPLQTRLICPDCGAVTCAICLEEWDKFNHDHRDSKIKLCDSTPKTIVDYLNENNIECPRCHFRYALARGGCMHLTCTQCRHEFCSGCSAQFKMGSKCDAKLPVCEKLGLHAHHPRNCLFYLRDKDPNVLCKLLEENAIPYLKETSGSEEATSSADDKTQESSGTPRTCNVPIQKETPDGLQDDICGKQAPEGYATVCKSHYVEYLGLLIWQNHLDPITILSSDDLEVIIRRANKKHPGRPYQIKEEEFRKRLLKVIEEEIPL